MPQLPNDVLRLIIERASTYDLNTLRKVNRTFHRITNERIARIFFDLVRNHSARLGLGLETFAIGQHDALLFRGDERPPNAIFGLGFSKFNDGAPHRSGEKVKNVVSTSTDPAVVRRKYWSKGGYVYAVSGVVGIDTQNFNDLEEIATLFIPPECVIAAIGPIATLDEESNLLVINNPTVIANPNCRLPEQVREGARQALAQLCRAPNEGESVEQ